MTKFGSYSINDAQWEIWHQDTFDADCPRQMELAGSGLVKGLIQLWLRHLYETVQPKGVIGFSRFNLWWKQTKFSIEIVGNYAGQQQVRKWVFSGNIMGTSGDIKMADLVTLEIIAEIHSRLVINGQTSEIILDTAYASKSKNEFVAQMADMMK